MGRGSLPRLRGEIALPACSRDRRVGATCCTKVTPQLCPPPPGLRGTASASAPTPRPRATVSRGIAGPSETAPSSHSPLGTQTREAWRASPSAEPLQAVCPPPPPPSHHMHNITSMHMTSIRTFSHSYTCIRKSIHAVTSLRHIQLHQTWFTARTHTQTGTHSCTPGTHDTRTHSCTACPERTGGSYRVGGQDFGPEIWASFEILSWRIPELPVGPVS